MNLHNEIMNITVETDKHLKAVKEGGSAAYSYGHRDARHVAAELSLKAQAKLDKALDLLQATINAFDRRTEQQLHEEIFKFLGEK